MKVNPRQYDTLKAYLALALSQQHRLSERCQRRLARIEKTITQLKPLNGEDQHWTVGIARALTKFNLPSKQV